MSINQYTNPHLDRSEKNIRKEYYKTPEGKSVRATRIGTILGGPLTGIIAGLTSLKVNDIKNSKSVEKGKDKVNEMMGIDEIRNNKVNSLSKSENTNSKRISRKTYNKFQADDVEGIVRNMSKTQYDDVRKHVGNSMDNGDWDKVEDYIARKYS